MTLKEIFDGLNDIAKKQPGIHEIIGNGNIYTLNEEGTFKFAVFCAVQDVHQFDVENNFTNYRFFLYYVDRLKSDESNKLDVQSTAVSTLKNIIKTFLEKYDVDLAASVDITPFTESFKQLCAGAYAAVSFTVYEDGCVEAY